MAEGEINIDNIIQRLLEGIKQIQNYHQFWINLMPTEKWTNFEFKMVKYQKYLCF